MGSEEHRGMSISDILRDWWDENKHKLSQEYEFILNRESQSAIRCRFCYVVWIRSLPEREDFEYALELNGELRYLRPSDPEIFSKFVQILKKVEGKHYYGDRRSYPDPD